MAPPNPLPDAYTVRTGTVAARGGYRVVDGIAVIDVFGALVPPNRITGQLKLYSRLRDDWSDLRQRAGGSGCGTVVLNIDSPGGKSAVPFSW